MKPDLDETVRLPALPAIQTVAAGGKLTIRGGLA